MSRIKAAPLDLILKANGKPTTDELRAQAIEERKARTEAELAACPKPLNANQRRNLKRVLAKAGKTLVKDADK